MLDFAEMYFHAAGQRVFSMALEGRTVLQNFDIYATAGRKQPFRALSPSA
jgi:Malectin domain